MNAPVKQISIDNGPRAAGPASETVKDTDPFAKVNEHLDYNDRNISRSLEQQASLRLHYAKLANNLGKKVAVCKLELNTMYAQLDSKIRANAADEKKKVTEKSIENEINNQKIYVAKQHEYLSLKEEYENAQALVTSFDHKRDCMVQSSKHVLQEKGFTNRITTPFPNKVD